MNNYLKTILLISLIVLVGCAAKEQVIVPAADLGQVNKEAVEERAAPTQDNPKVLSLLANKGIIPEIIYEYSRPPQDPKIYKYSLKGDKARIDLPRFDFIPKGEPKLDVVYLDFTAKKATAYCEEKGVCEDRNKAYDVDFSTYDQKNPYEWLDDIPGDAEIVGTEQINTRDVTHLKYERSGATTEVWVDQFYNVPLEAQVKTDAESFRYVYKLISVGGVKDSILEHQQLQNY